MPDIEKRLNPVPDTLRRFARQQRSAMPKAEDIFWQQVRAGRLGAHKFKRQVPIAPYVVDFRCSSARLVVELEGPHHAEPEQRRYDESRDCWLQRQKFVVLRFSNELILTSVELALDQVLAALKQHGPSPCLPSAGCPSPAEGGGTSRGDPP